MSPNYPVFSCCVQMCIILQLQSSTKLLSSTVTVRFARSILTWSLQFHMYGVPHSEQWRTLLATCQSKFLQAATQCADANIKSMIFVKKLYNTAVGKTVPKILLYCLVFIPVNKPLPANYVHAQERCCQCIPE